jgi:hypothetical protein
VGFPVKFESYRVLDLWSCLLVRVLEGVIHPYWAEEGVDFVSFGSLEF